jgi:hypothetical protein
VRRRQQRLRRSDRRSCDCIGWHGAVLLLTPRSPRASASANPARRRVRSRKWGTCTGQVLPANGPATQRTTTATAWSMTAIRAARGASTGKLGVCAAGTTNCTAVPGVHAKRAASIEK